MANIAVINTPLPGHVHPTLPLCSGLLSRGHRLTYFTHRDWKTKLETLGCRFIGFENDLGVDHTVGQRNFVKAASLVLTATERLADWQISKLQEHNIELVLFASACPLGKLAADYLRLPSICTMATVAINQTVLSAEFSRAYLVKTALFAAADYWSMKQTLRRLQSKYDYRAKNFAEVFSNSTGVTLVFTSREFQPHADTFSPNYHFVGPPLEKVTDQWSGLAGEQRPIIYVTMGTLHNRDLDLFKAVLEAFGQSDYRVVMTTGRKESIPILGRIPSNVSISAFIPQRTILRRAALTICHGGMNTVQDSLLFGVPLLMCPVQGEQRIQSKRTQELGAGLLLARKDLSAKAIREYSRAILGEPRFRLAAESLSQTLRSSGGTDRAVGLIEASLRHEI